MEIRLDGRTALVTGASRGIGKAIAAKLAASGANVMLSTRKLDALEAAVADIEVEHGAADGRGALAVFAANAGDPAAAEACVAATVERFGAVDILVNNAATNPYFGHAIDIGLPAFDKTVEVNWRGPLVWAQCAWRASMAERGGVVLNIASVGGMSVETNIGIYNGTKAALLHLNRTLAAEMAPGVRVNAIAPGLVKTDMARALWEKNEAAIAKRVPLRRLGEPDDIADAAVFLCSDAASWITGTSLVVDGGMLLQV
jgi:NAD(P)-dependent dehydrogenase (short-subunit alcohol dehydrogenase family)